MNLTSFFTSQNTALHLWYSNPISRELIHISQMLQFQSFQTLIWLVLEETLLVSLKCLLNSILKLNS